MDAEVYSLGDVLGFLGICGQKDWKSIGNCINACFYIWF